VDKVSPVLYLAGIALAFVIPGWECWSSPAWPSCGSCPTDEWSGTSQGTSSALTA